MVTKFYRTQKKFFRLSRMIDRLQGLMKNDRKTEKQIRSRKTPNTTKRIEYRN